MAHPLAGIWAAFQDDVRSRNERLAAELRAASGDLQSILAGLKEAFELFGPVESSPIQIAFLRQLLEAAARELLFAPAGSLKKLRPQERALTAIDVHASAMDDLVRMLPQTIAVSGPELLEVLKPRGWSRVTLPLRNSGPLPLRALARRRLYRESVRRARLDGQFLIELARASLLILEPWQFVQREAFRTFMIGRQRSVQSPPTAVESWVRDLAARTSLLDRALAREIRFFGEMEARISPALLARRTGNAEKLRERRQQCFGYWSRQQRASGAVVQLEAHFAELAIEACSITEQSLDSLTVAHRQVVDELDAVTAWMQDWQAGRAAGAFPAAQARLATAEERCAEWVRSLVTAAERRLPASVETVEPRRALPPRRPPWRSISPRSAVAAPFDRTARREALEAFAEAESAHHAVIRDIERAREVVRFSLETLAADPQSGAQIATEGIANALGLVEYQKQTATDPRPAAEQKLAEGLAASLYEGHLALERNRLGLLSHLARQQGAEVAEETRALVAARLRIAGSAVRQASAEASRRLLIRIGWAPPPVEAPVPVVRRARLGAILPVKWGVADLPLIYQRLFRLAPVEDPRFLIGRQAEMAAIAEARRSWDEGYPAAVMIVGARGSGKTSLLNCATSELLCGLNVVRGQFCRRAATPMALRSFLSALLAEPADCLESFLGSGRRVIILEETERAFLRTMNGFGGIQELLALISATSRNTLWLLSLNHHAFDYLNSAVGLDRFFTQRVNAMAVEPAELRNAILMRHNLSGLRLRYAPSPMGSAGARKVRNLFGLELDSERLFFDSLYRQSEGVFRSAFQLWLNLMDRVEGGVLHMQHPIEPNFGPLTAGLNVQDAFTLQAILQHGGMTIEEHAQVFECAVERSRTMLDQLCARDLLEPEPEGAGLRVKPEAGRLVREALHRLNLI